MTDTDTSAPADAGAELLSPLHDAHVALGASFTDFAGWQMPVRYSSDLAEHHAVRTAAGLFDLSHMGEILILGPEAAAALDFALAGRMSALDEGRAKYTLLLTEAGGVIDDLIVYRTGPDRFLVVANASNREVVAETLRARAEGFDALVEDESGDIALIAIQGPKSAEILANVEDLLADDGAIGDELDALKYYRVLRGSYLGLPVLIARTGYTGEDGFEIYIAPDRVRSLWDAILETGAGAGIVPAGLASRDTLRLEAGMPLYGHELGVDVLPAQAGLGRAVALNDEREFVGRAAVESGAAPEPDSLLAGRVLVGLVSDGRRAGRAGYRVFRDDDESESVGLVTSGALSPTLGYPIAMAYVDRSESVAGTVLSIDVRGSRIAATVVPLPFYKRES